MTELQSIQKALKRLNKDLLEVWNDIDKSAAENIANVWGGETADQITRMRKIFIDIRDYMNKASITDYENVITGTTRVIDILERPEATKKWVGNVNAGVETLTKYLDRFTKDA
ncbi:MAG TPA: hypothetical protein VJI75_00635 [Candidatus Nanoarchaeia archaeon]|nr:hypothetical protein [Candidatus Nanoarchaeia archaeon]